MANKQPPNPPKCEIQRNKQETVKLLPFIQNGDTDIDHINGDTDIDHINGDTNIDHINGDTDIDHINGDTDIDHINGYGESSSAEDSPVDMQTDFRKVTLDGEGMMEQPEILLYPNQNGVCPHNCETENDSGGNFKNVKKQSIHVGKHKDNPKYFIGPCDSVVSKTSKKYNSHNSACCDIFCRHTVPQNEIDEAHCSYVDPESRSMKLGWNDINGGGISGIVNPNLYFNSESTFERNCVSASTNLNVLEENERVKTNGRISRDTSEDCLSEMIDEGAVCDFDRLQLLEFEEMYEVDNLDIDNDHEFDELESPDILFPYLENNGTAADTSHPNLISPRQNFYSHHYNVTQYNHEDIGAAAQPVSVVCYKTVRCEDRVIPDVSMEDNGDFIDTDLPSKASGPNSSESFSESEEDLDNIAQNNRNDLSGVRTSYSSFLQSRENYSPLFDSRENCLLANKGSNFDTNKDDSLYPMDKMHLISHDESDNSSGSENGDNLVDVQFDLRDLQLEEFLSDSDHMSSSHPQGAVGNFRRNRQDDYLDDHGMNASGGALCEKVSNSSDLPAGCHCPSVNSSCSVHFNGNTVNNLSSGNQNSNLQNDESNKKQKIFNKFPIFSSRNSCGSQAAQMSNSCNHLSCDKAPNLSYVTSSSPRSDMSALQQARHLFLAATCEHMQSTSECGVSEPIYEDANECVDDNADSSKMGASGGFTENFKNIIDSENKPKKSSRLRRRKSSIGSSKSCSTISNRCPVEKVMIWSEYEAYIQQVKQIGTSACGPTAVINVLKALDINIDKDEVSRIIRAKLRMEDAPIPLYLFSRAVAGTEANDLLQGVETLTRGKLRGRFFKFWPPRDVHLVKWLGHWMKKGAVPLATLNLQKGVVLNQPIPDAWHHQMVYGISSRDVYLTNPLERVPEEIIMEQLSSDSILLINRQDVVKRFREGSDLRGLLAQSDERWCTMNVLGQVVNVLREESLVNVPGYRTQLTSHVSIPAVYETGITFFVQSNTDTWMELKSASELPLKADS